MTGGAELEALADRTHARAVSAWLDGDHETAASLFRLLARWMDKASGRQSDGVVVPFPKQACA
jgi:hypothetical protein